MEHEAFDPTWLQLREPVDHRSRSERLVERLRKLTDSWAGSRIVDLGAGTGSNLRYLAPRLPGPQHWVLIERDRRLLDRVGSGDALPALGSVETVVADLAREGLAHVRGADLVCASALLDLVSQTWLRRLTRACAGAGAGVLFTLSYDGSISWTGANPSAGPNPLGRDSDPADEWMRRAVNLHQRRDKGFGPALGPAAAEVAEALLRRAGYDTWRATTPWRLDRDDTPLALAMIDGWEQAALELSPGRSDRVRDWANRKRAAIREGSERAVVGHVDILGWPR